VSARGFRKTCPTPNAETTWLIFNVGKERMSTAPAWLIIGAFTSFAMGLVFGIYTVSLVRKTSSFLSRAIRLPGVVVELYASGSEGELAPRYTFRGPDGKPRTELSAIASNPPRYMRGQAVEVLFDPLSEESQLDGWLELRGLAVILGIFSAILTAVGAWGIVALLT
jgi:hypothetical protein